MSEPGLYHLISRTHKPEAVAFDRWVRHEVLPSIMAWKAAMKAAGSGISETVPSATSARSAPFRT